MNKIELENRATEIGLSHVMCNLDDLLDSGKTIDEVIELIETEDYSTITIWEPFDGMQSGDILDEALAIKNNIINIVNEATAADKDVLLYAREMLEAFKPQKLLELGLNVLLEKVVEATYAKESFKDLVKHDWEPTDSQGHEMTCSRCGLHISIHEKHTWAASLHAPCSVQPA